MNHPNHPGYPPAPQGYPPQAPMEHPGMFGGPAPSPAAWPASMVGHYEFSEEENTTIERAAAWSKGLGFIQYVNVCLQLVNLNFIAAILYYLPLGIFFWRGGAALTNVVETEGDDVRHLLEAVDKLGLALLIRIIGVSVVVLALLVAAALSMLM